ncbi:LamG domain-containing protein [Poriferisphaera corsica]|uniref:LamG domain-containing protein n=1 Tax=Poriferisphaera corsica TaxID=2528020 RepID=UPI00190B2A93|nr:LamG domain-containing protein [Poriferisphaera corsica]
MNFLKSALLSAAIAMIIPTANAQTVAHWNFESAVNHNTTEPVALSDDHILQSQTDPGPGGPEYVPDISGNENHLVQYDNAGAFATNVPYSVTPQTGDKNQFSWNTKDGYDLYEQSPGADGNPMSLGELMSGQTHFTIEVTFKQINGGGFQALVAHDREFGDSGDDDTPLGTFWLGISEDSKIHYYSYNPDDTISITDDTQTGFGEFGVGPFIELDQWYSVVITGDGSKANIYLKKEGDTDFTLIHTHDIIGLAKSSASWTIGRGWFEGPADSFKGLIDDVRISSSVLAPENFLASPAPKPAKTD